VGELNYRYFMFFLVTNGAFFWYGAYLIFYVLISEVSASQVVPCPEVGILLS
jgi:hypothetical protein